MQKYDLSGVTSAGQKKNRIGIVLSSGGIQGVYAHTGFMQAVDEMGIHVDAIAGCSAGAIVGGILASGTSILNWVYSLKKMTQKDFWDPGSLLKLLRCHLLNKGRGCMGLSGTESALNFIYNNLKAKTFEECNIPFYSLAINLANGEKAVFCQGELAPRIIASAAIPVLYEPIEIAGNYYCDGALVDFAPADAICCKHNLDIVIVHYVAHSNIKNENVERLKQQPWTILEIINGLLFRQRPWYLNHQPLNMRQCKCKCGAVIVVLEPDLQELAWPEVEGGNQIQKNAYEQAKEQLNRYTQNAMNFG